MLKTKHYDTRQYIAGMELTVRQAFEKMYCDMGVSDEYAAKITELAMVKITEQSEQQELGHRIHWDGINSYPPMLMRLWFSICKPVAYKWADENVPLAWWKLVFATKEQQLEAGFIADED